MTVLCAPPWVIVATLLGLGVVLIALGVVLKQPKESS